LKLANLITEKLGKIPAWFTEGCVYSSYRANNPYILFRKIPILSFHLFAGLLR